MVACLSLCKDFNSSSSLEVCISCLDIALVSFHRAKVPINTESYFAEAAAFWMTMLLVKCRLHSEASEVLRSTL